MDVKVRGLLPFLSGSNILVPLFFFFNFDGFVSEISPVIVRMFFFASESGYVNLGISEIIFKYYFKNRGTF